MSKLRVTIVQMDIAWEDKEKNLEKVHDFILSDFSTSDVFILPEMFSTGFSMNCSQLAESEVGNTVSKIKMWAIKYNVAICGSFIAEDKGEFYNRGFFITPENEYFYDKHHLFRMGNEANVFSAGDSRLIFDYKGFNICLFICYDLRFPVWARNLNNEYDLLVYVANWPASRMNIWNTLLSARAIENMCYVCGVNRVGIDANKLIYEGGSRLIDAKGNVLNSIDKKEGTETIIISKKELCAFREKFPVWKDADKFTINI